MASGFGSPGSPGVDAAVALVTLVGMAVEDFILNLDASSLPVDPGLGDVMLAENTIPAMPP